MRLISICGAFVAALLSAPAIAEDCPGNPNALGTSRTVPVNPAELPLIGTMSYRATLKLAPKEVVLTFDDGPMPPMSAKVLETLRSECVKATFFLIGRNAKKFPELVRKIAEDGHTIGTHSENHPLNFQRIAYERGVREIDDGIRDVTEALEPAGIKPLPWFRFPGFNHTAALDRYLRSRGIMAVSADFPADDWLRENHNRPGVIFSRAMSRLKAHGSGILLLHDVQPATALMLPRLLKELKAKGYRVVQMVPAEKPVSPPVADASSIKLRRHLAGLKPRAASIQPAGWWEAALSWLHIR